MITGVQIRIARHAVKWSAQELANQTGLAAKTIQRIESVDGVSNTTIHTMQRIQETLEAAGIEFIGLPEDRPGIRIGLPKL
jgi:transcriptional regulator with XRE-family HTH domain